MSKPKPRRPAAGKPAAKAAGSELPEGKRTTLGLYVTAAGAYEMALEYSKVRKAFGTEISNHQAIAFKLADMHTQIEAARFMVYKSAVDKDQGNDYDLSGAMAKLYASLVAMESTVEAVQIHGGNGYVKEYHVERLMRDAKITQIYEGTSEIQKIVISRSILGK